ncbi:transcriptional regulator [Thermomonospora umbrina]|uniref:Uncharacterized protein n=1 Tax=Thermomonospora umbrina TaxID=111806 RepID=A0A3D9SSB3_9ACTN|nr:transcriptional regulator [Thermomonospora umbrina]REE98688.1 hypothetical protein DFJ69_4181 [Thermomonospora umbrina]
MDGPDERRWREERALLAARRAALGERAGALYPDVPRVGSTTLLTRPEWIPAEPLPLEAVRLRWRDDAAPPAVDGSLARLPGGHRSYSEAMGALTPPAVFENRPVYRILAAGLGEGARPSLEFSAGRYFDGVDVGEAAAHELAADVPGLPLRTAVGDPRDLVRRSAPLAVTTVTLRRGTRDVVLHWRDPAKVAHAGGLHQVMPVGVFQPATPDARADFDLWRCMVREYGEEFLGTPEDREPEFTYDSWPLYRRMSRARTAGDVRAYCLGLGVDPLTFAVDLLTAVVIDDTTFDELFGALVDVNDEGRVTMAPFDEPAPQPMQPAGAAALALARWHGATLFRAR